MNAFNSMSSSITMTRVASYICVSELWPPNSTPVSRGATVQQESVWFGKEKFHSVNAMQGVEKLFSAWEPHPLLSDSLLYIYVFIITFISTPTISSWQRTWFSTPQPSVLRFPLTTTLWSKLGWVTFWLIPRHTVLYSKTFFLLFNCSCNLSPSSSSPDF